MYKEVIQDSLDYIEDNIKCDISAQELSDKARFVGEVIGQLSKALEQVDAPVRDANIYESVTNWAIPQLRGKVDIPEVVFTDYVENFGEILRALPTQVIHRDPNPGNIIVAEELGIQTILFNRDGVEYEGRIVNDFEELGYMLECM